MSLKTVDSLTALSPGCDLWIVAEAQHSRWARKLDWYLNFQIQRAGLHKSRELSPEIQKVIQDCEVELPEIGTFRSAPLMIASENLLPNSKTIVVPQIQDAAGWVEACFKIWDDLGRPLTRVFLPDEMKAEAFNRAWAVKGANVELVD